MLLSISTAQNLRKLVSGLQLILTLWKDLVLSILNLSRNLEKKKMKIKKRKVKGSLILFEVFFFIRNQILEFVSTKNWNELPFFKNSPFALKYSIQGVPSQYGHPSTSNYTIHIKSMYVCLTDRWIEGAGICWYEKFFSREFLNVFNSIF